MQPPEQYARDEESANMLPSEISVDLKWSCWSASQDYWEDHAPQGLNLLRTFPESLTIHTAPRNEIRFGTVTIECNGDEETCTEIRAHGRFWSEWDEPEDIPSTLGLEDEDFYRVQQARLDYMPCVYFDLTVSRKPGSGTTPAQLLSRLFVHVDKQEAKLLEADEKGWADMTSFAETHKKA